MPTEAKLKEKKEKKEKEKRDKNQRRGSSRSVMPVQTKLTLEDLANLTEGKGGSTMP